MKKSLILLTLALGLSQVATAQLYCQFPIDGPVTIFAGQFATLTATGNGVWFIWSTGETTNPITVAPVTTTIYTVTVTNAAGCVATSVTTVQVIACNLSLSTAQVNVLCNGDATGSIDLTVNGGVSPYTYVWSNGATVQDQAALLADTYTVTVTDAGGCTATTSVTITEPSLLVLSTSSSNVSCFGGNNGSAGVLSTGGTPGYTYQWSNGSNCNNLSGLSAGTYTVTVTDANGCTKSKSITVAQPASLVINTVSTNVNCNGDATGSIDLTVAGGASSYTYKWSNGATTQDLFNLTAGAYCVTVMDSHGCKNIDCSAVNQPQPLTLSAGVNHVSCAGASNGSIDLVVNGGTLNYNYAWSNGATTQDAGNLPAGSYAVTVTDANGCTAKLFSKVVQPPVLVSVSNLTISTSGDYQITITDANGCLQVLNQWVDVNCPNAQPLLLSLSSLNSTCGQSNGSIDLTVTGGVSPYTYTWSNGANTQDLSNIFAGTYTVTVTDVAGVTATTSVVITNTGTPSIWYADQDSDGYGDDNLTVLSCNQPSGYVSQAGDCNDFNSSIHPGAQEICGDGIDQDCDGADLPCGPSPTNCIFANVNNDFLPPNSTSAWVCSGDTLTLTASEGTSQTRTYAWSPSGKNTKSIEFTKVGVGLYPIQCQVTNPNNNNVNIYNFVVEVKNCAVGVSDTRNDPEEVKVYPSLTKGSFFIEGPAGMYFLTDQFGRTKKIMKQN